MEFVRTQLLFLISISVVLGSFSHAARAIDTPVYPQYTEAACILIAEQMERFKQQPHLQSHQSAARNYARHCQDPLPYTGPSTVVAQPEPHQPISKPVTVVAPTADISSLQQAAPDVTSGLSDLLMWSVLFIAVLLLFRALARSFDGLSDNERLGRRAEQQLARHLVDALSEGYRHYHNIILKTEQGDLTEIDHLITSPYGLFVIEVKNYKGWIFGAEHQAHWVQQHFKRKQPFQNPLRQNYKHTAALANLLEIDAKTEPGKIQSIIAFSSRAEFKTKMPDNVMYIEQVLRYIDRICEQGRTIGDEALLRYNARLNISAEQSDVLRSEHKLQLEGQELLRELNSGNR